MSLNFKGHLGSDAKVGDYPFRVASTPPVSTDTFVGGMVARLNANGELELCTAYNTANPTAIGLFRYSENTIIADLNGYTVDPRATVVRNAFGIGISMDEDVQTGLQDRISPYDTGQTYAVNNPLYVVAVTTAGTRYQGQLTNNGAAAVAGAGARAIGKVLTPPTNASEGTEMIVHIYGDIV